MFLINKIITNRVYQYLINEHNYTLNILLKHILKKTVVISLTNKSQNK